MLLEAVDNAREELKRSDHLIYVSLKYTRTADVLKSIIERLINAFNFGCEALLEKAKQESRVSSVPPMPLPRIELVRKAFPDKKIQDFMEFYLLLRKIDKAKFTRTQEYRRHVSMVASVDNAQIEITIDIISDYFERAKDFIRLVEQVTGGGAE